MRALCAVRRAPGITLLEMLVVLTVLGVVLGVSGLAIESLRVPHESQELRDLRRARAEAIQSGAPRTAHGVRFLPDGRAIGPGADALTGEPLAK
jgi:prepilin-type N-terminal cleavage/methylation domain-containing protein